MKFENDKASDYEPMPNSLDRQGFENKKGLPHLDNVVSPETTTKEQKNTTQLVFHTESNPSIALDCLVSLIQKNPTYFVYGNRLYCLENDVLKFITYDYSIIKISRDHTFINAQTNKPIKPPMDVLKPIIKNPDQFNFKTIKVIAKYPYLSSSGLYIFNPGYNPETQIFLDYDGAPKPLPEFINYDSVRSALERLMYPFKEFKFASPLDKSALLAHIFTALMRPVLRTAPAAGIDAPMPGVGKTLVAKCLAALCGETEPVIPHTFTKQSDDEIRKRILTMLNGKVAVVWDNVIGSLNSASLASMLTTETIEDRALNTNTLKKVSSKIFIIFTGNNLSLVGDLFRRTIVCRINPISDKPYTEKFALDPLKYVNEHCVEMRHAGFTILKAYMDSEEFKNGGVIDKSTGSFEEWDSIVRQCIAWIQKHFPEAGYVDIGDLLEDKEAKNPENECFLSLLTHLELISPNSIMAKDIVQFINKPEPHQWEAASNLKEILLELFPDIKISSSRSVGKALTQKNGFSVMGKSLKVHKSVAGNSFNVITH